MNEKISVIIPIYQVEQYLKKCVDTVLEQTYTNIEIILIDDGSKDNCPAICDEYGKIDKRIKVIHKKNGGLSDARNCGIDNATGRYLFFIDSDDWLDQDTLMKLYKIMKKNNVDIVECQYKKVFKEEKIGNDINEKIEIIEPKQAIENLITEKNGNHVVTWNKLYKKELFDKIRFPKGKIHEDEYTTYKLLYNSKLIAVTNLELYYYRQRKDSIITRKFNIKRLDVIQAYDERLKFYQEKKEVELYKKEIVKFLYILIYDYKCVREEKFEIKYIKEIKQKYKDIYKEYKKTNPKFSKEKIKYSILYLCPDLVFVLPVI